MPLLNRSSRGFGKNTSSQVTDVYAKYTTMSVSGDSPKIPYNSDAGPNNLQLTATGSPKVSGQNPFLGNGYYGNQFNGSTDYITFPGTGSQFAFGTGNFTIECWFFGTSFTSDKLLFSIQSSWSLRIAGSTCIPTWYISGANGGASSKAVQINTWNHIAVVRTGTGTNQFIIYLNGEAVYTNTRSDNLINTNTLYIGENDAANSGFWPGTISNVRIVKGTAVYTGNFTVPNSPLSTVQSASTNITALTGSETVLLTCQSNVFKDVSNSALTPTIVSAPIVTQFSPFTYNGPYQDVGGSWFNGSGDYYQIALNSLFKYGNNDFTIEFWAYFTSVSGTVYLIDQRNGASNQIAPTIYLLSGVIKFYTGGADLITGSTLIAGQWYHIALSRNSGTTKLYVNGAQVGSNYTDTNNYIASPLRIFANNDGGAISSQAGFCTNLRVVNGTGLYPNAFTAPAAPLAAVPNTALLTLQNNQSPNNLTFHDRGKVRSKIISSGDATQTTVTPFGNNWSVYFNGSTDYLSVANNTAFQFGSGDFTIEAWIYCIGPNPAAQYQTIACMNGVAASTLYGWLFTLNTTGVPTFVYSTNGTTNTVTNFGSAISYGKWYHFAVSCSSTVLKAFLNGTQIGSNLTLSGAIYAPNTPLYIGNNYDSSATTQLFNGYISNLRIVKGTSLYTSNFVPSASPLKAVPNTSLLACQSSKFVDNGTNFTLIPAGNPTVQKFAPFDNYILTPESYSFKFDGLSYIVVPDQTAANFDFNAGTPHTIEFWAYIDAKDVGNSPFVVVNKNWAYGSTGPSYAALLNNGNQLQIQYSTSPFDLITSNITTQLNTWNHYAWTRDANNQNRIFINGNFAGNVIQSSNYSNGSNLYIGVSSNLVSPKANGLISNLRIVKGAALYTSDFIPSNIPLKVLANTTLLTCQSPTFIDSANANPLVINGSGVKPININPFYTTVTPKAFSTANLFGGSAYFDGAGDYLIVDEHQSQRLGNAFTIQGWFNATSQIAANIAIVSKGAVSTGWEIGIGKANTLLYTNATVALASVTPIRFNEWNHFAVVRQPIGDRAMLFLNGNLEVTGAINNPYSETSNIYIGSGRVAGANLFTGYIAGIQIDTAAVYANNFVLPSSVNKPTANTVFFLDSKPTIIDDTGKNSIASFGDTSIRNITPHYKDGYYSVFFNGSTSSDYITNTTSTALTFGNGPYTVEFWSYYLGNTAGEFDVIESNPVSGSWQIYITSGSGGLNFGTYGVAGTTIMNTANISNIFSNVWTHFAIARNSNTINDTKVYINGNIWGVYTDTNNYTGVGYTIGGRNTNANYYYGFISNMRAVSNAAIYTGNFTPPTEPLKLVQPASANVLSLGSGGPGTVTLLACQSRSFVNNAAVNETIFAAGQSSIKNDNPFYGVTPYQGQSIYFDGTGDFIKTRPGDHINVINTAEDFTVEAWVYPQNITNAYLWTIGQEGTGRYNTTIVNGSLNMNLYGTGVVYNGAVRANCWTHIAISRSSNVISAYIDGIRQPNVDTRPEVIGNGGYTGIANGSIRFGSDGNGQNAVYTGYMKDIRITRGVGKYTGNTNPPAKITLAKPYQIPFITP